MNSFALRAGRAVVVFAIAGLLSNCGSTHKEAVAVVTVTATPTPAGAGDAAPESASPPAAVPVPNLVGQVSVQAAVGVLSAAGLRLGSVHHAIGSAPPWGVTAQEPAPGTELPRGSSVNVTDTELPKSLPQTPVPDVGGLGQPAAEAVIEKLGLGVVVKATPNTNLKPGDVVSQSPVPGGSVPANGSVTIWVAAPAALSRTVRTPHLVGLNKGAAMTKLRADGLLAQVQNDSPSTQPAGLVVMQYPQAGTPLQAGHSVLLIVSAR